MIAVRNWFLSGCASPNGCDDRFCALCNNVAYGDAAPAIADAADDKPQANAARDGAPTLPGAKKRGNLAFEKRHRVGPHR